MQNLIHIQPIELHTPRRATTIALDMLMALVGVALVTLFIYTLHLYPTIPNISIVYLLVILPLASLRGRLSALVASIAAFLLFNFFLVPPLYTFTIARTEEWVALGIFLLVALLTSQLATLMRLRTDEAWQRERETRTLYEVMHAANQKEDFADQLDILALSFVRVFSPWGMQECAIFLPDADHRLVLAADAPIRIEPFHLSPQEQAAARVVMGEGMAQDLASDVTAQGESLRLRILPFTADNQTIGILCLRYDHAPDWFRNNAQLQERVGQDNPRFTFFTSFLDQATAIVERGRLRSIARQ